MKEIVNYIKEGLKVNSKSKIVNIEENLVDKIIEMWGMKKFKYFKNYIEETKDVLLKWLNDYDIMGVKFAADPETLAELTGLLSEDIVNEYDHSYDTNEECQWKLDKTKILYSQKNEGWDIMGSKDIIALVSPLGTLYCLKK